MRMHGPRRRIRKDKKDMEDAWRRTHEDPRAKGKDGEE